MFKSELELIKDEKLRNFCIRILEELPDYFFVAPASSSGKYHPKFALGEGGLVRHTKMVVRIAQQLYSLSEYQGWGINFDNVAAACILHDGLKYGFGREPLHTDPMHPINMSQFIMKGSGISWFRKKVISEMVKRHMGQWGKHKPITKGQKLVHLADYIASRKFFDMYGKEGE